MMLWEAVSHPRHDVPPDFTALKGSNLSRRSVIFSEYNAAQAADPTAFVQNGYFSPIGRPSEFPSTEKAVAQIAIPDIFAVRASVGAD